MWGYEHNPSLNERREELNKEKSDIDELYAVVRNFIEMEKDSVSALTVEERDIIRVKLLQIVKALSGRMETLRQMTISKERSRDKLKCQAGNEWEKSQLAFVISSLITSVYDLKSCISNLLKLIDRACQVIATLNGVNYTIDNVVNLSQRTKYQHLTGNSNDPKYVKQRSNKWHEIRKKAKVTGSTLYDAVGLRTLKMQTTHYDEVVSNIPKPEPPENVKKMMDHGSENELHAVATVVTKVLPVLNPDLKFFEEGCYPFEMNGVPAVVSPDGSCRQDFSSPTEYGIEIKCPFPGNKFATPVQYKLPKYYVPQVLSEMKALNTDKLYFVSYSSDSTAVHEVTYDEALWKALEKEVHNVYGAEKPVRPTRKSENVPILNDLLTAFLANNVTFLLEVPSVKCIPCEESTDLPTDLYCTKHKSGISENVPIIKMDELNEIVYNAGVYLQRAYQLNRNKASELLGFMLSDLDRSYSPEALHSIPVAYGLKGYSLPTDTLRTMVDDVLKECSVRGLYVPVCSFDGQWCRLVIRDKESKPLTVLQLQKDVFSEAKKLSKAEIVKKISECNVIKVENVEQLQAVANIQIVAGHSDGPEGSSIEIKRKEDAKIFSISRRTYDIIQRNESIENETEKEPKETKVDGNMLNNLDDAVLDAVSLEIAEEIDCLTNGSKKIMASNKSINEHHSDVQFETAASEEKNTTNLPIEHDEGVNNDIAESSHTHILDDDDFQQMLHALNDREQGNARCKWNISVMEFKKMFSSAEIMNKSFLAKELSVCVKQITAKIQAHGIKLNISSTKSVTVNTLSKVVGDGSTITPKRNRQTKVTTLKSLAREKLKKMKKEYLNIIFAENIFPERLNEWYNNNPFGRHINIADLDSSHLRSWYSCPEFQNDVGYYIFMILDAYHQICGARRVFCLKGMPAAGVNNTYVHKIATESEFNGCGLRTAMVSEPMLDRQSVAFAVATFSKEVQRALTEIGAHNEARFCELVREWYEAEDLPGLPALERCVRRLNLREWLLSKLDVGHFPPCGSYVKDIPIVLFEGLLTGIERRIQLYPFTKSGAYNVRAIGSLDIENFFGSLQDIDPRGTGVLRPDDIATAISVAVELTDAQMNPER